MGVGLRNSTIETFRRRSHGDSTLRLLVLSPDGQSLLQAREISKGFLIGRDYDSGIGAYTSILVIQTGLSGCTHDEIIATSFVDLVHPTGTFQRFKATTDTIPQTTDDRYVLNLNAAFSDRRVVAGLIIINPAAPLPQVIDFPLPVTFIQTSLSSRWTVNHNLGYYPIVELFDSANEVIEGYVTNPSLNQTVISFSTAITGSARFI